MKTDYYDKAAYAAWSIWYNRTANEDKRRKSWNDLGKDGQAIWVATAKAAINAHAQAEIKKLLYKINR